MAKAHLTNGECTQHIEVLEERVRALTQRFDDRIEAQRELRDAENKALEEYKIAAEKSQTAAFAAVKEAERKADEVQHRVTTVQNEFRGTLDDYVEKCATKDETEILEKRLQLVEQRVVAGSSRDAGKNSISTVLWAMGASILTAVLVAAIMSVVFKSQGS